MSKKKAIIYSILVVFIGLLVTAGSYAYWSISYGGKKTSSNIRMDNDKYE